MRIVSRSALVPYSAEQMYALVANIEAYPEFLPWCVGASVHSSNAEIIEASLELRRSSIKKSFRTRNSLNPGVAIGLELVGGPFRHLSGGWQFDQLGDEGSKVSLNLEFAFRSRVTDAIFGSFLEETCSSLIDAFKQRADTIYG